VGLDTTDGQFTVWFDGTSQVVGEGVFFSFADHHAGGGNLVSTFRITDIEPEVDGSDALAFPVRLAFWDGTDPVETASVSIRPGIEYQVDGIVSSKNRIQRGKGNDRYNRSGSGQTLRLRTKRGRPERAFLFLENDGEGADRFTLRGRDGNRRFSVTYQSGGNVTSRVRRGRFATVALDPGQFQKVRVKIRPNRARLRKQTNRGRKWLRARYNLKLRTASQSDASKRDAARLRIKHLP